MISMSGFPRCAMIACRLIIAMIDHRVTMNLVEISASENAAKCLKRFLTISPYLNVTTLVENPRLLSNPRTYSLVPCVSITISLTERRYEPSAHSRSAPSTSIFTTSTEQSNSPSSWSIVVQGTYADSEVSVLAGGITLKNTPWPAILTYPEVFHSALLTVTIFDVRFMSLLRVSALKLSRLGSTAITFSHRGAA